MQGFPFASLRRPETKRDNLRKATPKWSNCTTHCTVGVDAAVFLRLPYFRQVFLMLFSSQQHGFTEFVFFWMFRCNMLGIRGVCPNFRAVLTKSKLFIIEFVKMSGLVLFKHVGFAVVPSGPSLFYHCASFSFDLHIMDCLNMFI